ncbi:MAG: DNA/RNA non-specific endonuclease [Bacteroidaceae bacterium]|nr:DNA/RNA non-specific endonuclease [Bacteroidaceae bacterium]
MALHRNKHIIRLCTILLTAGGVFLASCSSDSVDPDDVSVNVNANKTNKYPEASRLEIPQLKGGVVNMFLVKRVATYGINYCIEWDIAKKAQRWSAFRWDSSNSGGYVKREDNFIEDTDIPEAYRTTYAHYRGSGYTRGHICASADRWNSVEANRQTFLYSNMQPQLYDFNGGIWANLESKIRTWNTNDFRDTLYVVKGGTIDRSADILETTNTGLLVPKYFFMAILCKNKSTTNGGYKAIGFFMEHRDNYTDVKDMSPYIRTIDQLEDLTGIDFFCNLPDAIENTVEASVARNAWGFQ